MPGAPTALDNIRQAYTEARWQPPAPQQPNPLGQVQQQANQFSNSLRNQQVQGEQQIQTALAQAAAGVADVRQMEQLNQLAQQLQQQVTAGQTAQALQLVHQLKTLLADHQHQVSMQVGQSLCDAVAAMAQAQMGMFATQELVKLWEMLQSVEQTLQQQQAGGG